MPKLHFGTHLSAPFYCGRAAWALVAGGNRGRGNGIAGTRAFRNWSCGTRRVARRRSKCGFQRLHRAVEFGFGVVEMGAEAEVVAALAVVAERGDDMRFFQRDEERGAAGGGVAEGGDAGGRAFAQPVNGPRRFYRLRRGP